MKQPLFPSYVRTAILYFLSLEIVCLLARSITIYLVTGSLFDRSISPPPEIALFYRVLQFVLAAGIVVWLGKKLQLQWSLRFINRKHFFLFLGVACLFLVNNSLSAVYSSDAAAFNQEIYTNLGIYFLLITFSSTWEELLYRGAVQSYIDTHHTSLSSSVEQQGFYISYGNKWATLLMFARHLGFFLVFDFAFALTGLLLVLVFSLVAGWMRSTTRSLILPILLHCCCNYIYLSVHAYFAIA
ncbi:MAG: CPBP family glutamic-type intramembrane protease [Aureispira sp.]